MSARTERQIRKGLTSLYHSGKLRVGKAEREGWLQVRPGESSPRSHLVIYLNPRTGEWDTPLLEDGQAGWFPMCQFLGLDLDEAGAVWL